MSDQVTCSCREFEGDDPKCPDHGHYYPWAPASEGEAEDTAGAVLLPPSAEWFDDPKHYKMSGG